MQSGLSRRQSITGALGLLACASASAWPGAAARAFSFSDEVRARRAGLLQRYRQTIVTLRERVRFPIIDVEHHWGTGQGKAAFPVGDLIAKMDRNGVALTWLGVTDQMGDAGSLSECQKAPDRLVPTTVHGSSRRWHGGDLTMTAQIDADVRSGAFFAMGEFEARHYFTGTNTRDIQTRVTSPQFEAIFRAAEDTGLPFLIHHEAEDALLPEMEEMLTRHPNAKVVWCHVGRNRNPDTWKKFPHPDGVRAFIQKYPNLHFDILQAGPNSRFPPNERLGVLESVLYDQDRMQPVLRPEWRQLFNEHADRFLIGSDVNRGRWDGYDEVISRLRSAVLETVDPPAAEQIAFKNAWRLMGGDPWTA